MSFPTTAVLDSFTRADGDPGANWSAPAYNSFAKFAISSNQASPPDSDNDGYWNVSTFGPDAEVFATAAIANGTARLLLRLTSPGGGANGYRASVSRSTGEVRLHRLDGASSTQLGATEAISFSSGDKFGADIVGDAFTAYTTTGGVWGIFTARSDSTYTAAGYIGLQLAGGAGSGRLDDFGGGTVVVPVTPAATATRGTFDPELLPTELFDREML